MNNATCETCQRKQGTTNVALDEFYLKNHLGSTVAVMDNGAVSTLKAAYDYRATVVAMRTKQKVAKCCPPFGEQVDLEQKGDKVTENFTGICPQGECCENTLVYFYCRAEGPWREAQGKGRRDRAELLRRKISRPHARIVDFCGSQETICKSVSVCGEWGESDWSD